MDSDSSDTADTDNFIDFVTYRAYLFGLCQSRHAFLRCNCAVPAQTC